MVTRGSFRIPPFRREVMERSSWPRCQSCCFDATSQRNRQVAGAINLIVAGNIGFVVDLDAHLIIGAQRIRTIRSRGEFPV